MKKNNFYNNDMKSNVDKYSSMSEDELLNELIKMASIGKKDGSINDKSLDDFLNNVKSFLTDEQLSRLEDLIMLIKRS